MKNDITTTTRTLVISSSLQSVIVLVFLFGDIGIEYPGRFGLHIGHAIPMLITLLVVFFINIVSCLVLITKGLFDWQSTNFATSGIVALVTLNWSNRSSSPHTFLRKVN